MWGQIKMLWCINAPTMSFSLQVEQTVTETDQNWTVGWYFLPWLCGCYVDDVSSLFVEVGCCVTAVVCTKAAMFWPPRPTILCLKRYEAVFAGTCSTQPHSCSQSWAFPPSSHRSHVLPLVATGSSTHTVSYCIYFTSSSLPFSAVLFVLATIGKK